MSTLTKESVVAEVQSILTAAYNAYLKRTGKRKVSDNAFSRWLGVSSSNWNYWINGSRIPELSNALLLAPKIAELLGDETRSRFMEVLGYGDFYEVSDPSLRVVLQGWDLLPRDLKEQIHALIVSKSKPSGVSSQGLSRGE